MPRRPVWSLRAFRVSLAFLLLTVLLSAATWQCGRADLRGLCWGVLGAAVVFAAAASGRQWWVRRAVRRADFYVGAGEYGIDQFQDGRFIAR